MCCAIALCVLGFHLRSISNVRRFHADAVKPAGLRFLGGTNWPAKQWCQLHGYIVWSPEGSQMEVVISTMLLPILKISPMSWGIPSLSHDKGPLLQKPILISASGWFDVGETERCCIW